MPCILRSLVIFLIDRGGTQGEDILIQILRSSLQSSDRDVRVAELVEPWKIVILTHRHLIVVGVAILVKEGIGCRLTCLIGLLYQIMDRLKPFL